MAAEPVDVAAVQARHGPEREQSGVRLVWAGGCATCFTTEPCDAQRLLAALAQVQAELVHWKSACEGCRMCRLARGED